MDKQAGTLEFNPERCKWHEAEMAKLKKGVDDIKDVIEGNGHEGLKSKVARSYTATKINLGISCAILLAILKGCL